MKPSLLSLFLLSLNLGHLAALDLDWQENLDEVRSWALQTGKLLLLYWPAAEGGPTPVWAAEHLLWFQREAYPVRLGVDTELPGLGRITVLPTVALVTVREEILGLWQGSQVIDGAPLREAPYQPDPRAFEDSWVQHPQTGLWYFVPLQKPEGL